MLRLSRVWLFLVCVCTVLAVWPRQTRAAEAEFDNAKWKLQLNGWISQPSGYFNGQSGNGYFDVQKDFGFGNYATFSGKFDWRFKRKHHLLLGVTPVLSSQTTTLSRTIEWEDVSYDFGGEGQGGYQVGDPVAGLPVGLLPEAAGLAGTPGVLQPGLDGCNVESKRICVRWRNGRDGLDAVERVAVRAAAGDRADI